MRTLYRVWDKVEKAYQCGSDLAISVTGDIFMHGVKLKDEEQDRFVVEWATGVLDFHGDEIYDGDKIVVGWTEDNEECTDVGYVIFETGGFCIANKTGTRHYFTNQYITFTIVGTIRDENNERI